VKVDGRATSGELPHAEAEQAAAVAGVPAQPATRKPAAFAAPALLAQAPRGGAESLPSVSPRRRLPPPAFASTMSLQNGAGPIDQRPPNRSTSPALSAEPAGALVLSQPAAVSFDIPAARNAAGKIVGAPRAGAVYGGVAGTESQGVSDNVAKLLATVLQQVNPATYGKRTIADIVANSVRDAPKSSLIVVVRDKNIQGSSPSSDSVATQVTQASAAEYELGKLAAIDNPNAFAAAVTRIRLGAAKLYAAPQNALHVEALRDARIGVADADATGGQSGASGYGYVGQVVGENLRGSGLAAMQTMQSLARAANMKGLTLYTNAQADWYTAKLDFQTVAVTGPQQGVQSSHMVWQNEAYDPKRPTLSLDNPEVVNSLKGAGEEPPRAG
jgi:hypothetical protein